MIHGIINVYKEKGFTSHDVVNKLRGIAGQKKVGHTGTLDPDAEGVLPVCLGRGTKLCDLLTDKEKTYRAVLLLGKTTDTQDITGTVLQTTHTDHLTEEEVLKTIMSFEGEYQQIPPMYSALKVNGEKLCDIARSGRTVERKPRTVQIKKIVINSINIPRVEMDVTCSKGTYIRTLCNDIGEQLGTGGCMESLLRTASGRFKIEDSIKLGELQKLKDEGRLEEAVLPVDSVFGNYQRVNIHEEQESLVHNGNWFYMKDPDVKLADREVVRVYDCEGQFVALYRYHMKRGCFKIVKMFYM